MNHRWCICHAMRQPILLAATLMTVTGLSFGETPQKVPEELVPPDVDTDSLVASVRLREGLRILERYESFRLLHDQRGVVIETETAPADSLRLEALGWDNGPGMQSWVFHIPPDPDDDTGLADTWAP